MKTHCVLLLILLVCGCASSRSGREMAAADVQSIVKGQTTRAQIEARFGSATNTSLMPDGRRMAMYFFHSVKSQARGESFIPVYGLFAGGADTQTRQQQLQVVYSAAGVVEDYEFSDTTSQGRINSGFTNMGGESDPASPTPTPSPAAQPNP